MLNNRFAGEKLKYLQKLYENSIEMNGQIVCCKGVNDGAELKRSIKDLMQYLPFMRSVSVVPAGITKYREGLYPLELFTKKEAEEIIDLIESYQQKCFEEYGLHFIHASDEWYIIAEREFPKEETYDDYIQLENGVGMMRLLMTEFAGAMEQLKNSVHFADLKENLNRTVTIATGKLAYPVLKEFAAVMMKEFPGLTVNVEWIRNDFFGETITVSGLITGQDLIGQLKEKQEEGLFLGDSVIIPSNMIRSGEKVFLDDVTTADVEAALGARVVINGPEGRDFVEAVINPKYHDGRDNGNFVYIKAYDR
jgi:putative radical SAM enzyme (TIGR03279 family)